MKSNIMKKAWEIRKAAAVKFGCKVSEISMSESLKQAWKQAEGVNEMDKTQEIKAFNAWDISKSRYDRAAADAGYTLRMAEMKAKITGLPIPTATMQEISAKQSLQVELGNEMAEAEKKWKALI